MEPLEIVSGAVLERLLAALVDKVSRKHRDIKLLNPHLVVDTNPAATIDRQRERARRWASEVSFRDLAGTRKFADVFVDLDLSYTPARLRGSAGRRSADLHISDLASSSKSYIILGDPGAGKTTSLKRIALGILERYQTSPVLLLQFRQLRGRTSLTRQLLAQMGIELGVRAKDTPKRRELNHRLEQQLLALVLDELGAHLLFDGLDEASLSAQQRFATEIIAMLSHSSMTRVVLTCRSGAFSYNFPNTTTVEINPLSSGQIRKFALKWLGRQEAPDFLTALEREPYSGVEVRPLTLVHLCTIYSRTGAIPDRPRDIYRKVIRLYLEEWDEQNLVRRESGYAAFTPERKQEFLEALSYHFSKEGIKAQFTHDDLTASFGQICDQFDLPAGQARQVTKEIESHTGLIVEVGYEQFEFAHKSIQEFLTARYLLKLPGVVPDDYSTLDFPDEYAIAVAESSRPSAYLRAVLLEVVNRSSNSERFLGPFLRRLMVEKPLFRVDCSLGAAVVTLQSNTVWKTMEEQCLQLLAFPAVKESVQQFLSSVTVHDTGVGERLELIADLHALRLRHPAAEDFLLALDDPQLTVTRKCLRACSRLKAD